MWGLTPVHTRGQGIARDAHFLKKKAATGKRYWAGSVFLRFVRGFQQARFKVICSYGQEMKTGLGLPFGECIPEPVSVGIIDDAGYWICQEFFFV